MVTIVLGLTVYDDFGVGGSWVSKGIHELLSLRSQSIPNRLSAFPRPKQKNWHCGIARDIMNPGTLQNTSMESALKVMCYTSST